ncbi:MAG: Xaa-Pro peptidase family protein [Proteobacteria bacterium]|nr:Xaa-Pro peptidase family protein [Pseudomonadota bacterium]
MQVYENRVERLRAKMQSAGVDALMVSVEENRRYLTGFTGEDGHYDESAGTLFVTPGRILLATDSRYVTQAETESPFCEVFCYQRGLAESLAGIGKRLGLNRLGFEPARVSVIQRDRMQEALEKAGSRLELHPCSPLVEGLREIKDQEEVEAMIQSLRIAESVFSDLILRLNPDLTEKDLAWDLEKGMREAGADAAAFPCIVASGGNAAMPHAVPTPLPVGSGKTLLFDWGARLGGYCSDISRTLCLGTPDDRFRKVRDTVAQAQEKAIAMIRPGVSCREVDAAAREHIHQAGFEGLFGHGLGHGVGLAIHEDPRLGPMRETLLAPGMVFTVEPGIYIPGWGGVRLENMVAVTGDGCRVLNELPAVLEF